MPNTGLPPPTSSVPPVSGGPAGQMQLFYPTICAPGRPAVVLDAVARPSQSLSDNAGAVAVRNGTSARCYIAYLLDQI